MDSRKALYCAWLLLFALLPIEPAGALDILLTNDDGYDAIGIQTLGKALRSAGHRVTVVAPDRNYSGSSASLTLEAVQVERVDENEYKAAASPATCVALGLSVFEQTERPFDLVVSGTNRGANVGAATAFSGTVGATTLAILTRPIPALAMSANPIGQKPGDAGYTEHFEEVAAFATKLIGTLVSRRGDSEPLLPPGTALNVNFPALSRTDIKGVHFGTQGRILPFALAYEEKTPGLYVPALGRRAPGTNDVPESDATALERGFVTIVLLDGDYTAKTAKSDPVRRRLDSLTP